MSIGRGKSEKSAHLDNVSDEVRQHLVILDLVRVVLDLLLHLVPLVIQPHRLAPHDLREREERKGEKEGQQSILWWGNPPRGCLCC